MFCLKGYNQMLKKQIEMKILDEGTVLVDDWEHIEEGSIKRYTEQMDMEKKMLWQDVPKFGTFFTFLKSPYGFYLQNQSD